MQLVLWRLQGRMIRTAVRTVRLRRFVLRALLLSFGAALVACYAMSVACAALLCIFVPGSAVYAPNKMKRGNCHIYSWLKYLNEGGTLGIEPSKKIPEIPHSFHVNAAGVRTEFVPVTYRAGVRGFLNSMWFRGRIK